MWNDPITRFTLGVSAMFGLYWLFMRFAAPQIFGKGKLSKGKSAVLGTAVLYLPGLGFLLLLIKDLPVFPVVPKSFVFADYAVVFAAQFFAFVLMALCSTLEIKLGLFSPQFLESQDEENKGVDAFLTLTIIPLMEELLSRKLLGDVLGTDQLRLFLYMSALVFSLIHLQTGRIAVPLGMFYTGFLWAWLYAASGSLLLCTAYHIAFNLFMVFIPEWLEKMKSQKVRGIYYAVLALVGVTGFLFMVFNVAHYLPPELSGENPWRRIFSNGGVWVFIAVCVLSYVLGRWLMKVKGSKQENNGEPAAAQPNESSR